MENNQRAGIVTGGAAGIGLEVVRYLAAEGMRIVAVDRDRAACDRARVVLEEFGDGVRVVVADIGIPEGASAAAATAMESFGRIDMLCNNAAAHPIESLESHSLDTWRETFRVNVDGTLLCSQAVLPYMRERRKGSIINIGSVSGILSYVGGGAYAASKAAIAMFTKTLALEAGPFGIRVNCICPGTIRHGSRADDGSDVPAHIPLGRYGSPRDVASVVSFLASDQSSYMTGAIITLDGGATAGRARVSKRSHARTPPVRDKSS